MKILPAIDLLGGHVVRLYQGDYKQKQAFGDDPLLFAKDFEAAGARHLHVVDLDGAKGGTPANFAAVHRIAEETGLKIEFGGGVRDEATIERCFDAGIERVILGTAALRDPAFTKEMLATYPDKIAVGVDARDGKVAVEGWLETSDVDSVSFCRQMAQQGARYIIYTDIAKDGAEQGTNLGIYKTLSTIEGVRFIAAGGVSSTEEIVALRQMGLYGAILGKALYSGAVKLEDALNAAHSG